MPLLEKTGGIPISALYRATRLGSKSTPQISRTVTPLLTPTNRYLSTNLASGLRGAGRAGRISRAGKIDNLLNLVKARPLSFNNLRRILAPIGGFIGYKGLNALNKSDIFDNIGGIDGIDSVDTNLDNLVDTNNPTSSNYGSLSKNIKNIVDSNRPLGMTNISRPLNTKRHGMSMDSEKPTAALRSYLKKNNNISNNIVSKKQLEDILDEIDSKMRTT